MRRFWRMIQWFARAFWAEYRPLLWRWPIQACGLSAIAIYAVVLNPYAFAGGLIGAAAYFGVLQVVDR